MPDSFNPKFNRKLLDFLSQELIGTEFAPADGGVAVEAVVLIGWVDPDGDHGWTQLTTGSVTGAEGLLRASLRSLDEEHRQQIRCEHERRLAEYTYEEDEERSEQRPGSVDDE